MIKNLLLILCEGAHDVSFLYKLLKDTLQATSKGIASLPIKEFPKPISRYFLSSLKNFAYENSNLDIRLKIPKPLLWNNGEDKTLILLYNMGGDQQNGIARNLIEAFKDLLSSEHEDALPTSLAIFYDADEKGVQARVKEFIGKFQDIIPEITDFEKIIPPDTYTTTTQDNYQQIGLHIFANEEGKGNLEDILLPLMREGNEAIFDNAKKFLEENQQKSRSQGKLNKAIIGVAGNLVNEGKSNEVIIKDKESSYITEEKLLNNPKTADIIGFFKKMLGIIEEAKEETQEENTEIDTNAE